MKLLIITQKVDINDDVLGFFHGWITEFSKHCEKLIVICLQKGEYNLPSNVEVLSLGKENRQSRIKYVYRFYKYIWQKRKGYDRVFVHMNVEYVLLGSILWRIWKKKVALWYMHKTVDLKLKIAEKFVNKIFTASKKSFRLNSDKLEVVGHGIDIHKFYQGERKQNSLFKIITVGRISPIKDYETLLKAILILVENKNTEFKVEIIGAAGTPNQEAYLADLKKIVKDNNLDEVVNFVGAVPNKDVVQYLQSADLFVSMSNTGSLDKAVLEAMACELLVLTSNDALINDVLSKYQEVLTFPQKNYKNLADKIKFLKNMGAIDRGELEKSLRSIVVKNHNLDNLTGAILKKLSPK